MIAARDGGLDTLVDRWVGLQIITADQGRRIVAAEEHADRAESGQRTALVVEAVGYLGGAIAVAAAVLISARYWDDVGTAGHLLLLGALTLGLGLAGAAAPADESGLGRRLRAVLWLGATAAAAGFLSVLSAEALDLADRDALVLATCGVAALATALWRATPSPAQQIAMMVALAVAAAALVFRADVSDSLPGVGVAAVGLLWAALGQRGVLDPPWLALSAGAATAVVGAMMTSSTDAGTALALVTVVGVVGAGVVLRDLRLLGVGTAGLLLELPAAITRWFPDTAVVPYVLLAVGSLMVVLAVAVTRRDRT